MPKYIKFHEKWFDMLCRNYDKDGAAMVIGNIICTGFGCDTSDRLPDNNIVNQIKEELKKEIVKQNELSAKNRESGIKGGYAKAKMTNAVANGKANAMANAMANATKYIDIYYNNNKYIVNNILLEYIQHISHIISTKTIDTNYMANAMANGKASATVGYEKELCMFDFLVKLVHNTTLAEYAGELTTFVSDIRFALFEYIKMLVITKHYKTDDELRMFIKNLHSTFSVPSKADSYLQKMTRNADATLKVNPPKYENKRNTTECVEQQPTDFVSEGIARAGL